MKFQRPALHILPSRQKRTYILCMPKYMKHFITLAGVIIVGSFLAYLYDCITGLSEFAGRFNPELTPWVFWILLGAVGTLLGWMAAMAFMRPKPMMVYADPTDADREKFHRELTRRLAKNKFLKEAGVDVRDPNGLENGLTALHAQADLEIKSTAKRVFIGTAVSQNGRLDTLVVLYLISRLVWRIAKLYNQRPNYRELVNLYANIAATSFLAGSIEEFGIEDYVRELMGPMVGGSAIGAVPGAQAIASTITASVLTGSTNCLLALRCGIVARDYVSLNLDAKGRMRRSATIEASKMFVTMSAETVTYVTRLLVKSSTGAVKSGTARAFKGMGSTLSGTAGSVGDGARRAGEGVKGAAGAVGSGVKDTAEAVGKGVKESASAVGDGVKKVGRGVKESVEAVGEKARKVSSGVKEAGQSVKGKADSVLHEGAEKVRGVKTSAKQKIDDLKHAGKDLTKGASSLVGEAESLAGKGKETVRRWAGKWGRRKTE